MPESPKVKSAIDVQTSGRAVDSVIGALADRQHGVVSWAQLLDAGVGREAIQHRLERGRLRRLHRGVYTVGHAVLTPDGRRMAGVLAMGREAVLSHRAAAAHWGLRYFDGIEITLARRREQRPGIRVHQLPLRDDEITIERGVPITTPHRTLFDLAAVIPRIQVERAMHEADIRRLPDHLSLPDLLRRYPRRVGAATIRAILQDGALLTRSEFEARFLAFVEEFNLPIPEVNVALLIAGVWIECDFVWRSARVIVELDGRAVHDTAYAFERDRARDRKLQAMGWRTVRITWRQLRDEPEAVAYDLRTLLTTSAGTAPSRSSSQRPSCS
jgi:predicted transcriptional regulator of viral defense system